MYKRQYLFYEMLSLATFPLVTHHQDKEARSGGRIYLSHLLGTSIGFALPALIWCYVAGGGADGMNFSSGGFPSVIRDGGTLFAGSDRPRDKGDVFFAANAVGFRGITGGS